MPPYSLPPILIKRRVSAREDPLAPRLNKPSNSLRRRKDRGRPVSQHSRGHDRWDVLLRSILAGVRHEAEIPFPEGARFAVCGRPIRVTAISMRRQDHATNTARRSVVQRRPEIVSDVYHQSFRISQKVLDCRRNDESSIQANADRKGLAPKQPDA